METDYMQVILNQINKYFYTDYAFLVWLATTLVCSLFKGIKSVIHPKWITLVVATICAIGYYAINTWEGMEPFSVFKIVTSLGLATLSYDYVGKPIIDKVTGKPINQGKTIRR